MALKITTVVLWIIVIFFGILGLILFFCIIFNEAYYNSTMDINTKLASEFGNFFGGFIGTLFAITSTLLILVTLIKQNIANKKSQIGANFFKMLDYHAENVKQLNISHIDIDKDNAIGRRAFVIFKMQLDELQQAMNRINNELELELKEIEVIDIAYMAFYYGIDSNWIEFAECKLLKYERRQEIAKSLLNAIKDNPKRIGRTNQTSLSSYYRNLYNAIKLIDSDKYLSSKEKHLYIKILRAQLSNPELYVLFFNVVSRFGKKWDKEGYIEKYELIKNIPSNYLGIYNPRNFFSMTYEEDELD